MSKKTQKLAKQLYTKRTQCDCIAQKHQLINNCLNCGKVVCAKEGEGPCFGCGKIVSKPDSNYAIANDQSLFPSLPKQQLNKVSQQRSKAILHRNKLVERDQSTNQGQNIYDEQLDYYEVTQNQWIDQEDRQRAVERILKRDIQIERQQFVNRVKFDPITGKFEKQQVLNDRDAFKEQGKNYAEQREAADYNEKMKNAKKKAFDSRLLNNEKMNSLVEQLNLGRQSQEKQKKSLLQKAQRRNNNAQVIMEQENENKVLSDQLLQEINA